MNDISIITLLPTRWQEYKTLRLEALQNEPAAFGTTYAEAFAKPDDYWQTKITKSATQQSGALLFAQHNDKLIGMASTSFKDSTAHIHAVYVSKKYRDLGVAKKLITKLVEIISSNQNLKIIELDVNVDNLPAIKLYQKLGFKINAHYTEDVGGVVHHCHFMQKNITTS